MLMVHYGDRNVKCLESKNKELGVNGTKNNIIE
jgi:hypothetical protein